MRRVLNIAITAILLTSCASLQGNKIPTVVLEKKEYHGKLSVAIYPEYYIGDTEKEEFELIGPKRLRKFKKKSETIRAFSNSNFFSEVIVSTDDKEIKGDLIVKFKLYRTSSGYGSRAHDIWFWMHFATLTILPLWSSGSMTIEAEVYNKKSKLLKKYKIKEDYTMIGHLLLFPVAIHRLATGVIDTTLYNLVSYFVYKLDDDGLLKPGGQEIHVQ